MITNFEVNAGFAAARLRNKLEGLQIMAIVGYVSQRVICQDDSIVLVNVPQWRTGIVKQFQPDILAKEIVLQFQWSDEEGTADIGIFQDEDIVLLLTPEQCPNLKRLA